MRALRPLIGGAASFGGIVTRALAIVGVASTGASCGGHGTNPSLDAATESAAECGTGYVCVPDPAGWIIGVFDRQVPADVNGLVAAVPCPFGYVSPVLVSMPADQTTCSCQCQGGTVFCTPSLNSPPGPLAVSVGGADSGCLDAGSPEIGWDCYALALSAGSSIGYDQIPIWRDPCAANLATTTHHVVDQVCAATATAGGGCGIGEVCVPQVPEPWTLGAFQKTDQAVGACPQAWAAFLEQDGGTATAQAMATQWNDFNACSSCNCNPDMDAGCENPNLALYTDPSCTSVAMSLGPNTCTSVNVDVQSARYSATAVQGSGCSIVQPTQPTGIESPMPGAGYLVCHGQ